MHQQNEFSLASGIRLIGDDVQRFRTDGSIEFSAGIISARAQYRSLHYWDRAFVPKLPWRRPSDSELDLVLGSAGAAEPGKWIQLIKIEKDVLRAFAGATAASRCPTDLFLRKYKAGAECREAIAKTVEFARTLTWPEHPNVDRAGVFFKAPGLPTTTPSKYPELLGIHIDSAYKQIPLGERKHAPGRISINLGPDDRFLLFVPVGVDQIQEMLRAKQIQYPAEHESMTHEFRTAFMSHFPDFPVVKVRVRSGEAYIAPTENMIHDGCTLGQNCFDVQFSACGHFRPQSSLSGPSSMELLSSGLRRDAKAAPLLTQ